MKLLRLPRPVAALLACSTLILGLATASAQTAAESAPEAEPTFADHLASAGVKLITGPSTVPLGRVAEFKLPAGFHAVDPGSIKRFYELTENVLGGDEAGVVLAPDGWMLFFDYDETGYIKDDEKDDLNADKLLSTMRENQAAANKQRAKQGWDQMKIAGWAAKPHYDTATNNLKWAISLTSSSDDHATAWVNENIRLLGRGGVMNVTLVTDTETFARDSSVAGQALASQFTYIPGQRYAEFREGDKIAKYGLSALVLGGGAAAAYKLGFLQKFWKIIAGAGIAVLAVFRKVWNKITGRDAQ